MNQIPDGTHVELKPGCDEVYSHAWAGSRGIVTASSTDEYGFGKVFIKWDQEHWRYNGEPDGWTFASHFQPIDSVEIPAKEAPEGPDLMGTETSITIDTSVPDIGAMMHGSGAAWDEAHMESYIDSMMHGFDRAAESDGFVLVTMRRAEDPEMGEVIVYEVSRGSALSDLSDIPGSMILSYIGEHMRYRGQ